MKLYANQLPAELNKGLKPCYMLFGDEPFQISEARDLIKASAKNAGIEEVIRLVEDDLFDWQDLRQHCQEMSLFATSKIIELELTSSKIAKQGAEVLKEIEPELNASPGSEIILVLFGPKLDAPQTKTAWFKSLSQRGNYVPVYEIDGPHLKRWLGTQLSKRQLTMAHDAQDYLLAFTAGNLLACSQELDKLKMALPNSPSLSLSAIQEYVENQSRYTVFQLMEAILSANAEHALTILSRLKLEEFEPNIILWSLQKDALILKALNEAIHSNSDINKVFDGHRIWKNKQAGYRQAAQRLSLPTLNSVINDLAKFDLALKQFQITCPYTLAAHICIKLCGIESINQFEWPITSHESYSA